MTTTTTTKTSTTAVCAGCGAVPTAAGQRYCDECGTAVPGSSLIPSGNIVGDGSDRAMTGVLWQSRRQELTTFVRSGRPVGLAARAVVLVVGAAILIPMLVHLLAAVAPVVLLVAFLHFGGVFGGRRRARRAGHSYRRHRRWAP